MDNFNLKNQIMYKENGEKKYAYVCLFFDIKYLPGTLVLVESLKKAGSFADLVILVNKNTNIKDLLMRFFDKIIIIEDNLYEESKFNKFWAYNLLEYEKIIIIDADAIILRYPDYIFSLEPPGLCIVNNQPYSGLILIKPDKNEYNKIVKEIKTKNITYKDYIKNKYINFTKIDNRFVGLDIPNNDWKKLFGIQFINEKPFFYESKFSIDERITMPNYNLWFYYYRKIINKNFDLLEKKELTDVNELSKYYINNLSRQVNEINNILNNFIKSDKNKFNIIFNTDKIKKNYELYHINDTFDYSNEIIMYLNKYLIDMKTNIDKYTIINDNVSIILLINKSNNYIDKEDEKNIIFKEVINLNGMGLKNVLFNINNKFVYRERKLLLNKKYKDNDQIIINLLYYKTLLVSGIKNNNSDIIIISDTNTKIKITSLLRNSNSLILLNKGLINFLNFENERINILINQSLIKWIYNKYNGDELDNLLVVEIIKENNTIKKIIIIDNNKKKNIEQKKLLDNSLFFLEIIFVNSKIFLNKIEKYQKIILNIDNEKYYYKIDGIKYAHHIFNNILNNNNNEL
jgi:hypothetical protein